MQYFYFVIDNQIAMIINKNLDQNIWIPIDEQNTDYREYLAWVAEGNVAEPWQPEEPPVEEVTAEEPVIEDAN